MAEVGTYLRELRRARGYTQEALAEAADTSTRTIERIERGAGTMTVPIFARIIASLQGSALQALDLATRPAATVEEAKVLAHAWLAGGSTPTPAQLSRLSRSVVEQIVDEARELDAAQIVDVIYVLSSMLRDRRDEIWTRDR